MSANVSHNTLENTATKVLQPFLIVSNNLMKLYFTVKDHFQSSTTVINHTVYHHYNDIFYLVLRKLHIKELIFLNQV